MNLLGTTGQDRQNWLERVLSDAAYYVPPELRGWGEVAQMVNPVEPQLQSMAAAGRGDWGEAATQGAIALAPAVGGAVLGRMGANTVDDAARWLMETQVGWSPTGAALGDMGQDFVADQSGAIKAWHGSPHDFDKFSLDKIGTGEGAQAYGHGLYFADQKAVAEGYRDALVDAPQLAFFDGRPLRDLGMSSPEADIAMEAVRSRNGNFGAAIEFYRDKYARALSDGKRPHLKEKLEDAIRRIDNDEISAEKFTRPEAGRLYEVNIDANPEDFLDWDAPLSAQPERVREWALDNMQARGWQGDNVPLREIWNQWAQDGLDPSGIAELPRRGEDIYRAATNDARGLSIAVGDNASTALTPAQAAASNELFQGAGIPGIRYLDAGSRGAGDGSRNYVVFDDSLVSILNKYGLAGLFAGGAGMNALAGDPYAEN